MCHSRSEREYWEARLAREADEDRVRLIQTDEPKAEEPEPEREDEREGELIRV